jgi:SET domain-containing protein
MSHKLKGTEFSNLLSNQGVEYLSRSRFQVNLTNRQCCLSNYFKNNQIEFQQLYKCYHSMITDSYIAPCYVAYMDKSLGHGLFADRDLKKDEFLAEYTGLIKKAGPTKKMHDVLGGYSSDYAWTYPVRLGFFSPLEVDGRLWGNETRFINHSFTPNLRMEHYLSEQGWILFLLFNRDVTKGEQLTVDYGEEYWSGGIRELVLQ